MTAPGAAQNLNPDRLLPAEPGERAIARRLYDAVRDLPVISPHGHVDPRLLLANEPFPDPATLLVTPDHYVTRLLHADGVGLDALGVGQGTLSEDASRAAWRLLCERWDLFRGTPVRFWLEAELAGIFGVTARPSKQTADVIYDQVAERLGQDAYRPRALFDRFRITVLATTDDPCSDLAAHAALAADPAWSGRVIPTFRPDRYLEPAQPGWREAVARLGEAAKTDTGDYAGYVRALEERRRLLHRPRRDLSRPQPRRRADRPARARRGGAHLPRGARRRGHRRGSDGVPAAHAGGDGPDVLRRRTGDGAASRRAAQPSPAHLRAVRAGHRP